MNSTAIIAWSSSGRSGRRRRGFGTGVVAVLAAFAVYVSPLLSLLPAREVRAEVSPINLIIKQMQKPNMLIMLDTSGSMNGVPGSLFSYSSEVGVDCDNGTDCRGWKQTDGVCASSGKTCTTDADCLTQKFCRVGLGACTTDTDCPSQGTCTVGSAPCRTNADCTATGEGRCATNQQPCNVGTPCPLAGNCSETGGACSPPGSSCKAGRCRGSGFNNNNVQYCADDIDCGMGSKSCRYGSTPRNGCNTNSDCSTTTVCTTGETCLSRADCPVIRTGTCRYARTSCQQDEDCLRGGIVDDSVRDACDIPTNECTGNVNVCEYTSFGNCVVSAGNTCTEVANSCVVTPNNTCFIPTPNACLNPNPGDYCQIGGRARSALKMCQVAQSLCNADADCPSGDTCGEPTSRAVVAKRTLAGLIEDNRDLVNLGFMTFYQGGYFPYVQVTAPVTRSVTTYLSLMQMGACYDPVTGPLALCRYQGNDYTLAAGLNSVYEVRKNKNKMQNVDAAYCGAVCNTGALGTGAYQGSYYRRNVAIGTPTTTVSVQSSYRGPSIQIGGATYNYFAPSSEYYNGAPPPPIEVADCAAGVCSAKCGARWDTSLSPMINPLQTTAQAQTGALQMLDWMRKAKEGGLVTYGGTPTGCSLENAIARTVNTGAYQYMSQVTTDDEKKCRLNYVMLITDGEANGPGDSNCTANACSAADPEAAGCTCRAVLSAWHLRKNLGVKTFVVAFSSDAALGVARTINDNIARAGGTDFYDDNIAPYAYLANNEVELVRVLNAAVLSAVRGSYSTSPAASSSGTQLAKSIQAGKYALDARVDFPSWDGHLLAYDVSVNPPVLAWDANEKLRRMNWWERRIYIGSRDGSSVRVAINPSTKDVTNKDVLFRLGLGSSEAEAADMIRFAMGDPAYANPNILGAMINSTPIDVAGPGNSPLPGGADFFETNKNRPGLTYVGASDGMLHAFFTSDTSVAGQVHEGGSEAFAYIPPGMLPTIAKLYALGGQPVDPRQHVFGLANSPKVKNLCVANCSDGATAVWKTYLIMNEGFGGSGIFMLDITSPVSENGFSEPPVQPVWHSDDSANASQYAPLIGYSISVPGFFYNKTPSLDDHRLVFASGYKLPAGASSQGKNLVIAEARSGQILDSEPVSPSGGCAQTFTMLADVATEKDYYTTGSQKLRRAYIGDTWGKLWEYDGTNLSQTQSLGCNHPIHFSPTVVQLDRDDSANNPGQTYIVQVTNSNLDVNTENLPASKVIIMKRKADDQGGVTLDTTFGTGGILEMEAGTNEICAETADDLSCDVTLPVNARPMGTPIGILKSDGSGFQFLTTWYASDVAGCTKGTSWLTLHNVVNGNLTQAQGLKIGNEPISGPVIAGGRIYVVGSNGAVNITGNLNAAYTPGIASPRANVGVGTFNLLSWTEIE